MNYKKALEAIQEEDARLGKLISIYANELYNLQKAEEEGTISKELYYQKLDEFHNKSEPIIERANRLMPPKIKLMRRIERGHYGKRPPRKIKKPIFYIC